jgi:CheY-like chemotaxis protein
MSHARPYILVAEDDTDDVDFLKASLARRCPEIAVTHVSDGQAALDFLTTCPSADLPFLLLLDYKMPIVSAAQVLLYLNTSDRFLPMICAVWSTSGRAEEIQECEALGADRFFTKPASDGEWDALAQQISEYFHAAGEAEPIALRS